MSRRRFASAVAAAFSAALLMGACTGGSDQDASDNDPPPTLAATDDPSTSRPPTSTAPTPAPSDTGPQLPPESYLPSPAVGDRWVYTISSADGTGQTITDTETVTAVVREGATQVATVRRVLRYDDQSQPDTLLESAYVVGDDGALTVRFAPSGPDPSPAGIVSGDIAIPAWAALQAAPATGSIATGGVDSTTLTWSASSSGTTQVQVPSGAYTARVVAIDVLGADTGLVRALLYTADGVGPVRLELQAAGRVVKVAQLVEYDPA